MTSNSIERGLAAYTDWRDGLTTSIVSLQRWLDRESLTSPEYAEKITQILNYVGDDNLYVSFVSEYSRGKTELINTLFFSEYGKRVLPSGVGRTTMCPTEFFYNTDQPLGISLLPIETHSSNHSISELKNNFDSWINFSINAKNSDEVIDAFKHLQDTIRVPTQVAKSLGFPASTNEDESPTSDGLIEIPKWRHALVNIKHPLLEQKLVILDTPGLNAIGAETNLTIKQLQKSHSIVFLLDNSAGVTKSDFDLWSKHIKLENNASRIIALNKIDSLWSSIDNEQDVNNEINKLVSKTAKRLNVAVENVFPVSAKFGLIGKVLKRKSMLKKSRVYEFEKALAQNLVPSKKQIVLTNIFPLAQSIAKNIDEKLSQNSHSLKRREKEISSKLKTNHKVSEQIQSSLNDDAKLLISLSEQHSFIDTSFANPIKELRQLLDLSAIERAEKKCHTVFKKEPSITKKRSILLSFLRRANQKMHLAVLRAVEIEEQCKKIANSDIFKNNTNVVFRRLELDRHLSMLNNIEQSFLSLDLAESLPKKKQKNRLEKAFDNCSLAIERTFKRALNETNDWRRTLISPLETRVRKQSKQLNDRKSSINQLVGSNQSLKEKLKINKRRQDISIKQKTQLYALVHNINKHLMHSGYTEDDLYKPEEPLPNNNVVKIQPSAS